MEHTQELRSGHLNLDDRVNQPTMKKKIFKALSKLNKKFLPSYTKKELDLRKASKVQMAIIGWKSWVTRNSLD
ncbi:hypothetical protein SAMN05660903_00621 [Salegentibacter salinarum]|nr:hypothetical protein SAMN05660903_00621 [Salegentibacter salinarum]